MLIILAVVSLAGLAGGSECPVELVDLNGGDLGNTVNDVADAMSCCLICREHQGCGCWSWGYKASASANACWLKKAAGWNR